MATPTQQPKASLRKVLIPVFILAVLVASGLFMIKLQLPQHAGERSSVAIRVGSQLPDFPLTELNGGEVPLSKLQGKVFMLNFWATWCDACMEEMPSIIQLRESLHSKGFEVLAINLDENPDTVIPKAIKQFQIRFPVFKDPDGKTAELFDVHAIPLTVIINQQRKILMIKDGGKDWNSPIIHSEIERWLTE